MIRIAIVSVLVAFAVGCSGNVVAPQTSDAFACDASRVGVTHCFAGHAEVCDSSGSWADDASKDAQCANDAASE